MQLEDPRKRYKQLQNERCSTESIVMQPLHGSPYHVYPASSYPAVKAFQGPQTSLHNVSASPLLSTKSQLQVEMSPLSRSVSPQTPRMGNLSRRQTIQETSFTNPIDTDAVVAKINNMFPTASETHIRLLLKKYYNREAVVISALQVEKHPVTMPGPYVTPPAQRHLFHSNSSMHQMTPPAPGRRFEAMLTSRTNSPIPGRLNSLTSSGLYGSPRFSPKPHSSPKMKLRYMKSIFPKADETLLLDILANADNNVQKASEQLISMGYKKRDVLAAPKLSSREEESKRAKEASKPSDEMIIPLRPKVLTTEEKEAIKQTLQTRYSTIAERIILMALDSVNYSEDRASQILEIVLQEDETKARKQGCQNDTSKVDANFKEAPETISESRTNESPKTCETALASTVTTAVKKSTSSLSKLFHRSASKSSSLGQLSRDGRLESTATESTILSPTILQNPDGGDKELKAGTNEEGTIVEIAVFESECTASTAPPTHEPEKSTAVSPSSSSPQSSVPMSSSSESSTIIASDEMKKTRSKAKSDRIKTTPKSSFDENNSPTKAEFQSIVQRVISKGADPGLCKGPNEDLLLADYITWSGANPDISLGHKSLTHGPNPKLLSGRIRSNSACSSRGHNTELCKGPQIGLAKGSIYSQINRSITTNVKCN